ncbi:MAG TPA: hypothetical protein VF173_25460 [Thermoanaerobaculia bacterium]|nr:hypothetical protein [Thermoanaerobaculia bacterium]
MPPKLLCRASVLLALWLLAGTPLLAQSVGVAIRVNPQVDAYLVGKEVHPLRRNDPIERGLTVLLRDPSSFLLVGFNLGGCLPVTREGGLSHQFTGTASLDGRTEMDFGDPKDPSASRLWLALGRIAMKLLPNSGCPPPETRTPHAVIRPQGTAFRVLVDSVAGTFVGVDEGSVMVQAEAGGEPVEVKAGQWVLVPPGGLPKRPGRPSRNFDHDDPPLLGCCTGVEPPKPPQ